MATVLYTSTQIHSRIKSVLSPSAGGRRVAIVAYVGAGAAAYIPQPKGLELICCPAPGATDHNAVAKLIDRGAQVRFSDKLHMKVYWSEHGGCLISSANLSSSALGAAGLKEAGVFLPAGTVDIDRLIQQASPRDVTPAAMRQLDRDSKRLAKQRRIAPTKVVGHHDFLSWYRQPYRQEWKLGAWDGFFAVAKSATVKSRADYNVSDPHEFIGCRSAQYVPHDWILAFRQDGRKVSEFSWQFVDFVVPVAKSDTRAYEKNYANQAVQVHARHRYPDPPFKITPAFRKAIGVVLREASDARLTSLDTAIRPPAWLLTNVAAAMA